VGLIERFLTVEFERDMFWAAISLPRGVGSAASTSIIKIATLALQICKRKDLVQLALSDGIFLLLSFRISPIRQAGPSFLAATQNRISVCYSVLKESDGLITNTV
jgi:hypothetical protein